MSLTVRILLGMLAGIVVGLIFNIFMPDLFQGFNTYLFNPLGTIFLNLIKMLVVPIVVISLILGTAGISDPKKLGRMGGKTIVFFLVTTAIAITVAMATALVFKPGVSDNFSLQSEEATYEASEAPPIMDTLLNIIPTNAIDAMVQESM